MNKLSSLIKHVFHYISFGLLLISLSGCYFGLPKLIHDSAVKKFPTYAETEASWEPLPAGYSRIVAFLNGGIDPTILLGVVFDNEKNGSLSDKTFVFIDLPAGQHSMKLTGDLIFGLPKPIDFNTVAGEITYIRVNGRKQLLGSKEVQRYLGDIHHCYRLPLPFDKQAKSAEKPTW